MGDNLRGRVAQRANGQQQPGAEVAQRPARTIVDEIRAMEGEFARAMPRGAEAAQLVRDAITAVRQTRNLAQCDAPSVLGGLMTCAQLGLRPGVLGHAWLLPFWDKNRDNGQGQPKGGHRAQLVIGYQGLVELVHRSDRIVSIAARTVYSNDEFRLGYGLEEDDFVHNPCLDGPRGEPRLYYAIARMKGGGYALTDPMTHAEMEAYRDAYAMAKKDGKVVGPWADQFEGMAHKTMIRRLVKLLPKSTELAQAIEADEKVRVDLSPDGIEHGEVIEGEVLSDVAEPAAEEPAPERPQRQQMATQAQMSRIHAMLKDHDIESDDGVRKAIGEILNRPPASRTELTRADAATVIDHLEKLAPPAPGGEG